MTRTSLKYNFLTVTLLLGLSVLLGGAVYSGYRLSRVAAEREQVKEDYSLSNSVTFGLFSVDQWRDRIKPLLTGKIQDFHITKQQQRDLQATIEKQMHSMINQLVAQINKPQKGVGGKLKKLAFNALVKPAELHAQVRPFAHTIVVKVSSPESEAKLKAIAGSKVNQLTAQIYDSTSTANYVVTKYVYKKYQVSDPISFNQRISERIATLDASKKYFIIAMLGCVATALLLWLALRKQVRLQTSLFVFALLFAGILLTVGSLVPLIEVDARISSLDLLMLGQKVHFQNQILFYQSKSIWGITQTLMGQQKPDAIAVGVLITLFVLVLPLLRLIAKGIYVLSTRKIARHPVVRYLTFELGKWDMADVMVVGALMTYIGLNGILKSELSLLNIHTESLTVITENGSSLQPGYFIFTGYVVFSWLLSYVLKKVSPHDQLK